MMLSRSFLKRLTMIVFCLVLLAAFPACSKQQAVTPTSAGIEATATIPSTTPAAATTSTITIIIPEEPPNFNAVVSDTGYDALVMHIALL
jgi:hypothetical protein